MVVLSAMVAVLAAVLAAMSYLSGTGEAGEPVYIPLDSPYLWVPLILLFGLAQEVRLCARYH